MDKVINLNKFGTSPETELGFELDDNRGRQDDKDVTRLFPQSAGGGGQSVQRVFINRYRPGNRYKQVRLNGTIVQYNAVGHDLTFATESQRSENVVAVPASNSQTIAGVLEFGDGGPLTADPALTSHAAGVFGFITTRGKVICNVDAATIAGDFLAPLGGGTVGRLHPLTITGAYVQADQQRTLSLAAGLGARALVAEPPTQPSAWKANLTWVFLQ